MIKIIEIMNYRYKKFRATGMEKNLILDEEN